MGIDKLNLPPAGGVSGTTPGDVDYLTPLDPVRYTEANRPHENQTHRTNLIASKIDDELIPLQTDLARTVAPAGNHTTITDAVEFYSGKTFGAVQTVAVDPGTYVEQLNIGGLTGTNEQFYLHLIGDTRELSGASYVDSSTSQAVGGNAGSGTVTVSNPGGNDIAVSCSGTNPDFGAAGVANGDRLAILDNAGTVTIATVASASGNTFTLTAAPPAVGNNGTSVTLLPNRSLTASSFNALRLLGGSLRVTGFEIVGAVPYAAVEANANSTISLLGCVLRGGANGAVALRGGLIQSGTNLTLLENTVTGVSARQGGMAVVNNAWSIKCGNTAFDADSGYLNADSAVATGATNFGFFAARSSALIADSAFAINCSTGYCAKSNSNIQAVSATALDNSATGYEARDMGNVEALFTVANNSGNTADYNPSPSATLGNNNAQVVFS